MVERVKKANANTLIVVDLFEKHPLVAKVNYPSRGATFQNYERHRRQNGGYGNVLSVVFHKPESAQLFYDKLDVCKGSSFGTNFTLVIPFVQLAAYQLQEKLEKYELPKHILRINVGLEDPDEICAKMSEALVAVEEFEQMPRSVGLGA
jgi:cystathionine gamma-synthase